MADAPAPAPEAPPAASKPTYTLKFEPVGDFTDMEIYLKGCVRGKFWLSENVIAQMKSLTGEEIDTINAAVKPETTWTVTRYNTEVTNLNLALSLEKVSDRIFGGTLEEKVAAIRKMGAPILSRMQLAFVELNERVNELFAIKGKEAENQVKKS